MNANNIKFRCIAETWDPHGDVLYDSVDDFIAMCKHCYGEVPNLSRGADNRLVDEDGNPVLEPTTRQWFVGGDPGIRCIVEADTAEEAIKAVSGEGAYEIDPYLVARQGQDAYEVVDTVYGQVWRSDKWVGPPHQYVADVLLACEKDPTSGTWSV